MMEGSIDDITEWFDGLDREQVKAVDRVSLVLLFSLSEECFHDLFGSAKRRAPQPAECIAKIEQAALRSDIENADGFRLRPALRAGPQGLLHDHP